MYLIPNEIDCRKQCLHCGCGRGSHSIETEPSSIIPLIEGLTLTGESSKLSRADVDRLRKYAWYPPGLSYGMVSVVLLILKNPSSFDYE